MFYHQHIEVYDHSLIPQTCIRPDHLDSSAITPLLSVKIEYGFEPPEYTLKILNHPDGLRFLLGNDDGILGVTLKDAEDGALEAEISELLAWPPDMTSTYTPKLSFSHHHGLAFSWSFLSSPKLMLARFNWQGEDERVSAGISPKISAKGFKSQFGLQFDETAGKTVFIPECRRLFLSDVLSEK